MIALTVDFHAGFAGDTVEVVIAGKQVFHKEDLSTDYSIGLAASFQAEVPAGPLAVRIAVPSRGLERTLELRGAGPQYVGVSVAGDALDCKVQDEPFQYF